MAYGLSSVMGHASLLVMLPCQNAMPPGIVRCIAAKVKVLGRVGWRRQLAAHPNSSVVAPIIALLTS